MPCCSERAGYQTTTGSGLDPRSQCCDTWKQATSYWETAAVLLAVPAETPLPAYTCPATPPLGLVADGSLNADPGAEAALPGSLGAESLRQVWPGCPVLGFAAKAVPLAARASPGERGGGGQGADTNDERLHGFPLG